MWSFVAIACLSGFATLCGLISGLTLMTGRFVETIVEATATGVAGRVLGKLEPRLPLIVRAFLRTRLAKMMIAGAEKGTKGQIAGLLAISFWIFLIPGAAFGYLAVQYAGLSLLYTTILLGFPYVTAFVGCGILSIPLCAVTERSITRAVNRAADSVESATGLEKKA